MTRNPLIGTWRLLSWQNEASDGSVTYPMGADAIGLISYTGDGYVLVHIARADRTNHALDDLAGGSEQEFAAAMKSMIAYAGPYDFRGDHVVHDVILSSFPNWVGTDQKRHVRFEGDRMRLSTDPLPFEGREITASLLWERVRGD